MDSQRPLAFTTSSCVSPQERALVIQRQSYASPFALGAGHSEINKAALEGKYFLNFKY
jgi:hypothetical protein